MQLTKSSPEAGGVHSSLATSDLTSQRVEEVERLRGLICQDSAHRLL